MNDQRSELSTKNKYWVPKFRYLELKNHCFQYPDWKRELNSINPLKVKTEITRGRNFSNPTEQLAMKRIKLEQKMRMIETTVDLADPFLAKWLLKGVTENYTYEYLRYKMDMPAGRDMYYDRYRRFFWLLDQRIS